MALRRIVNRLREARKSRGLSGYDLQILSRIPACDIYRIERGLLKPKVHHKHLLSEALGVSVPELFPVELEKNPTVTGRGEADEYQDR